MSCIEYIDEKRLGEMEKFAEVNNGTFKSTIATLVFMDLETTGLPCDVGKKNVHITEMCLIAIDRNSFEEDGNLRALNKLSLCIRPRSVVSPGAMDATGLYNDILENQKEFDDSIPKLLEYFFRRLPSPICLLAHNGNKFDFPVLQAELKRINFSLSSDVLCADTLLAFRSICLSPKPAKDRNLVKRFEKEDLHSREKVCDGISISEDDIDNLLSQDLESFSGMEITALCDEGKSSEKVSEVYISPTNSDLKTNNMLNENLTLSDEFLLPIHNEQTPKHKIPPNFNGNVNIKKRKTLDYSYPKNDQNKFKKRTQTIRRNLFPEQDVLSLNKITKFTLENLYNHFFHKKPSASHYAENDCISLSQICQKINADFLQWIDENSMSFSSVNALW